jgi:hypothetical protein
MWDSRDLSYGGVLLRTWDHVHCGVASSIGPYVSTSWVATLRSFLLHNFVVSSCQVRNKGLARTSFLSKPGPLYATARAFIIAISCNPCKDCNF